jgi:hypothetical protein
MMSDDAINYLTRQILGQNTTKYWTGEGYGSYENNARAIATFLSNAGITDIRQFGVKQEAITEPVSVISVDENGKPTYGKTVEVGDSSYIETVDSSKVSIVDGQPVMDTGRKRGVYYNKKTGQTLSDIDHEGRGLHYVGDEYDYSDDPTKPNQVAQTYAGKGGTGISVQFDQDGLPYFFTHYTGSTSDWDKVAPVIGFGLSFIPGLNVALGSTLLGAGASTVASAAVGSAVIGGTISELSGGDFLKGAVTGAITGGAGNAFAADIGGMLGLEGNLAKQVGNAIISGAKAEISGGDFAKGAAISGLMSTVSNVTGFSEKDVASTVSFVSALDSGDPLRIAAATASLSKLDYFNEKKATEIFDKLKTSGYEDLPDITEEEIQDWAKTPDYKLLPDDYVGDTTKTEELFDATEISHGGKAGDQSYFGDGFGYDMTTDIGNKGVGFGNVATGLITAAGIKAVQDASEPSTAVPNVLGTTPKLSQYSSDIYKDAPIKGFAMRRYEDEAGNTKYVPFIGNKAQLDVPSGYTFKGYAKGGFVSRRS